MTTGSASAESYRSFYRDRSVMITGGLGFIGSNLARRLVQLGARVLIVDSLIPDYGGNFFNIDPSTFAATFVACHKCSVSATDAIEALKPMCVECPQWAKKRTFAAEARAGHRPNLP